MPSLETQQEWPVALARALLAQNSSNETGGLLNQLVHAVETSFIDWRKAEERRAQNLGEEQNGIAPPRDRASYIYDYVLPRCLDRKSFGASDKNQAVIGLLRTLEPDRFIALVLLYAARFNDVDGVRRAYDVLTMPSSPYRELLETFHHHRRGGLTRSRTNQQKKIIRCALELLEKGASRRDVAGMIAQDLELSSAYVRRILKKNETLLSKYS